MAARGIYRCSAIKLSRSVCVREVASGCDEVKCKDDVRSAMADTSDHIYWVFERAEIDLINLMVRNETPERRVERVKNYSEPCEFSS